MRARMGRRPSHAHTHGSARPHGHHACAATTHPHAQLRALTARAPPLLPLYHPRAMQGAIDMFNLALELPGNGAYRLPGSPREYLCPSDAEENAAL